MLSASTVSSSSSGFSPKPEISTPSSQLSFDSKKANHSPLSELIEAEQSFIETINMIDSHIGPIWVKQMASSAPDFSELLRCIHAILKANKQFCEKLTKIAAGSQSIGDLGDTLMQWVRDLEIPYANYSRSYIPNLGQRQDIAENKAIQSVLQELSSSASYDLTLESLFNAPIQQLKYYKELYNRLKEGTSPDRTDYRVLMRAIEKIDTVIRMVRTAVQLPFSQADKYQQQDQELAQFQSQVDCSQVVDLYSDKPVSYTLELSDPNMQLVMRDSFDMLFDNNRSPPMCVHLVLTTDVLIITQEINSSQFALLYPAIPINHITVKADMIEKEAAGEYVIQLSVLGKKQITLCARSKETQNTWTGSSDSTPRTLSVAAQKKMLANKPTMDFGVRLQPLPTNARDAKKLIERKNIANIRTTDIVTFYSESEHVSPIESSDDEDPNQRDTIMNIYDKRAKETKSKQDSNTVAPQQINVAFETSNASQTQVKLISTPPKKDNLNVKDNWSPNTLQSPAAEIPVKAVSHVQQAHIEPHKSQIETMYISDKTEYNSTSFSPLNQQMNKLAISPDRSRGNDSKPSSPRAVEVQRAIIPQAMQAVTQKTNDYLLQNENSPAVPRKNLIPQASPHHPQQRPPHQQQHRPQGPQQSHSQHHYPGMAERSPKPMPASPHQPRPMQHVGNHSTSPGLQKRGPPPVLDSPTSPKSQLPNQFNAPSPTPSQLHQARSTEDFNRPYSPGQYNPNTDVRQVLFSNDQCQVFHWKNDSWYAVEGQCLLQIRLTHSSYTCVTVELQNSAQLYLNAWILPDTVTRQPSATDISISLYLGMQKENYLVHFQQPQDASVFFQLIQQAHSEAVQMSASQPTPQQEDTYDDPEPVDTVNVPQSSRPILQCKAKLFIKNETSSWSAFGSVNMQISQQSPSMRMLIEIQNDKTKLVSSIVRSGNVEKIGPKRISFLLTDESSKTSIVYMIHVREDQNASKIFEYLRIKNAENGW
ncbi:hypothetical protein EDC96DRAFT_552231 [Choanephora cucurbitarum]|nr:hypothetical protein EDC96DRAFT_552231 [Choanephora cucurbitarum]